MRINKFTFIFLLIFVCGCSAGGFNFIKPNPEPDNGVVILYQKTHPLSPFSIGGPKIELDGNAIDQLAPGNYIQLSVTPGEHKIDAKGHTLWAVPDQQLKFTINSSEIIYIRYHWGIDEIVPIGPNIFATRNGGIYIMTDEIAIQELSK